MADSSMTGANFNLVTVRVKLGENDADPEQNLDEVSELRCPRLIRRENTLSSGSFRSKICMILYKVSCTTCVDEIADEQTMRRRGMRWMRWWGVSRWAGNSQASMRDAPRPTMRIPSRHSISDANISHSEQSVLSHGPSDRRRCRS